MIIELGKVTEETKGVGSQSFESAGHYHSS
jgi:hypothetical protein